MPPRTHAAKDRDVPAPAQREVAPVRGRHLDDVTLLALLPPGLAFRDRADVLAELLPQIDRSLAGEQVTGMIAENEALRRHLADRLMQMVSLDEEPRSRLGALPATTASIAGTPLPLDGHGRLTLRALDGISVTPFALVLAEELNAAAQLVEIERRVRQAMELAELLPALRDMAAHPTRYAYNLVEALKLYADATRAHVGDLYVAKLPHNEDQENRLQGAFIWAGEAIDAATDALAAAGLSLQHNQPGWHPGEAYWRHEDETYGRGDTLGYLGGGATEVFHFAGNVLSGGHMDRSAANARAYREGHISWEAYQGNLGWNYLSSAAQAVITAATAGQGGRIASWALGRFGLEAGAVGVGGVTASTTGLVSGALGGASGAMTSDAVALAASYLSDDPYVRDYQRGLIGWPRILGLERARRRGARRLRRLARRLRPRADAAETAGVLVRSAARAEDRQVIRRRRLIPELTADVYRARRAPGTSWSMSWTTDAISAAAHARRRWRRRCSRDAARSRLSSACCTTSAPRVQAVRCSRRSGRELGNSYELGTARVGRGCTTCPDGKVERLIRCGMVCAVRGRQPCLNPRQHRDGEQSRTRAFRVAKGGHTVGTTAADAQQGAGVWAGDQGWVFQIDGTPSWNVADLLEGRSRDAGWELSRGLDGGRDRALDPCAGAERANRCDPTRSSL